MWTRSARARATSLRGGKRLAGGAWRVSVDCVSFSIFKVPSLLRDATREGGRERGREGAEVRKLQLGGAPNASKLTNGCSIVVLKRDG